MGQTSAASTKDWIQAIDSKNMQISAYTPTLVPCQYSRGDATEGLSNVDALYRDLIKFFAERLAATRVIERIYMSFFDREIDIWTLLKENSETVRRSLYEIEEDILTKFQGFIFDFHIYSVSDAGLDDFEKDPHILRIYPQ